MPAQSNGLVLTYGPNGLERLTFHNEVLEDTIRWPADQLHIWHMKCFDPVGKVLQDGDHGWGENSTARSWDASSKSWTFNYSWGYLKVQYRQSGDTLDILVTSSNLSKSGIIFDGASVYPVTLHLPGNSDVSKFAGGTVVDGAEAPGVTFASWAHAAMAAVAPDARQPGWSGFQQAAGGAEAALFSSTWPDVMPHQPEQRRGLSLKPGQTVTQVFSLRFGDAGSSARTLAPDVYRNFAVQWPQRLNWPDRRPIGTEYLASSPAGEKTHGGGFASNPRRYFNEASVDTQSPRGLAAFQARVLAQAEAIVRNMTREQAQGVITWDIEGEEFPQDTSYVCSPDQIAAVAPETESVVNDHTSKYAGMKLDDAYFRIIHDAGLRVGVCVRPQRFVLSGNHTATQQFLPDHEVAAELIRKMRYAHDRWGATLFYLDSTVRADGTTLPAAILEEAAAALPDSLLIPEESTPRMNRATVPFATFLFHGDLGTSADIRAVYPQAFSANLINDVSAAKLQQFRTDLVQAVRGGDVLMVKAGDWQANNATVFEIYREAKPKSSTPLPR